jgi:hypothetical protein
MKAKQLVKQWQRGIINDEELREALSIALEGHEITADEYRDALTSWKRRDKRG